MPKLYIDNPRERLLVASADLVLQAAAMLSRPLRRRRRRTRPRRILLLRLERIGDLVMALPAIGDVRSCAPDAQIDLVVGSWNADIARALTAVTRFETLDAAWLARDGDGLGLVSLLTCARRWRRRHYDLAINFEPDIRSNLLVASAGAAWTAGYRSGGGGALLDLALDYDTRAHTTDNARRLVTRVFGKTEPQRTLEVATLSQWASETAEGLLDGAPRPLVGVHVSGGRAIKQWDLDRFADVARRLIVSKGATIVLTGSAADRPMVDTVKRALPESKVIDAAGDYSLITLAALLDRLDVLVTGDTGPMHLAATVGTPIVAVFGPSDPIRYAPRGPNDRIVRVDLPCSPCNRIRVPPERCIGHTPDCLALVSIERVFAETASLLDLSSGGGCAPNPPAPA
jgi:lipopolysaccharide heptosyltransferase II